MSFPEIEGTSELIKEFVFRSPHHPGKILIKKILGLSAPKQEFVCFYRDSAEHEDPHWVIYSGTDKINCPPVSFPRKKLGTT